MNASAITSAALVTSPARGGIAVIVLTGPETERIIGEIFRPRSPASGGEGHLSLGRIVDGSEVLDEAIISTVADDTVEINIHGSLHVARRVLSLLGERGAGVVSDCPVDSTLILPASGPANPAITEEVLAALRLVSTPLGASAISAQWSGGLSSLAVRPFDDAHGRHEDIEGRQAQGRERSRTAVSPRVDADALRAAADALPVMRRLLEPADVVIAGPPNVGKSALANAMVGRNVSIVSEQPGTTRDWVATLTDADGVPVRLTDTAGLWEEAVGVDAEAVRRAWQRVESADLVICLTAGNDDQCTELVAHLRSLPNVINVAGKCDLFTPVDRTRPAVSATSFTGIDSLRRVIRDNLGFADFAPASAMAFTDRQAGCLRTAAESLDRNNRTDARSALDDLLNADIYRLGKIGKAAENSQCS